MTIARFLRLSDAPPPARELVTVEDDGTVTLWRSIAPAVGRFTRTVADPEAFAALARAAAAAPRPGGGDLPHDAVVDRVHAGDATATVARDADPGGPWGALLAACRALLDPEQATPVAAVALVIEGPDAVRLEHRGSEPLEIELGAGRVDIHRWRGDDHAGSAQARPDASDTIQAAPGWSLRVPVPGLDGAPGDRLTATARFVVVDGGAYIPVVARAAGPDR